MAWPVPGMATMAARLTVLLVMVPLALATMAARVTALLVMLSLALALVLLSLLPLLPALVLAGTRAHRLELKTRRRVEASGLVRGWQLPRLQEAVAVAEA